MEKKPLAQPRSFYELVIAGFSLVALPLLVALVSGAYFVGRLYDQSQEAVYRAVLATQESRSLFEQVTAMERSVRQYAVLGDAEVLNNYRHAHQGFKESALRLRALLRDDDLKRTLADLMAATAISPPRSACAARAIWSSWASVWIGCGGAWWSWKNANASSSVTSPTN